jgi:hypothetical protein
LPQRLINGIAADVAAAKTEAESAKNTGGEYRALQTLLSQYGNNVLKEAGYDGIVFNGKKGFEEVVVFDSTKIKSTANTGTFNPEDPDIRYSLSPSQAQATNEVWDRLGLAPERKKSLTEYVRSLLGANWREAVSAYSDRAYEGLFDGLINVDRAEAEVGVTDFRQRGYVSMRLATGIGDVMYGVLHHGAPQWRDGRLAYKPGTKGLLTILGDLGPDLRDWLGWMAGNRAQELMAQGRENNLTQDQIQELLDLAKDPDKAAKFLQAKDDYTALNTAMLDVAEQAGLIDPQERAKWESEWYVPFYRQQEVDGEVTLLGPRTRRGLSHQSAGIRALHGGEAPTNDLLENILANWTRLVDASMKNHALVQVADNLNNTRFMQDQTTKFRQALVSKEEMIKRLRDDKNKLAEAANLLGIPAEDVEYALNEVRKLSRGEFERLWTRVAPEGKDIIRVQRNGKNHYYQVLDPSVLRSIASFGFAGFNDPVTRTARAFKRMLTTGITSMPDFIIRNFVRDVVQAWTINPDKMRFASSALRAMKDTYGESDAYWDLIFSGASFQGGYVHGNDPEASAQIVRRALGKKGMSPKEIAAHQRGVLSTSADVQRVLSKWWQKYREWGDKAENINRLATYQAAIKAGKPPLQAAFEAKDFMDYSLRGNYQALLWLADVVPFLNARIQGLGKLGRAMAADPKTVGMKMAKVAAFTLVLALLNGDDERYKELEDWKKDAYWHFWLGDEHFMVPKPFEVGVIAGAIPERMWHTLVTDNQENEKLWWSIKHNLMQTFSFNPIPQMALPVFEVVANRSFFFDRPIENMADEGQLPWNRYNTQTSDTMRKLGEWLGTSPKQMEHLFNGYLGTLGMYLLTVSDWAVRGFEGAPDKAALTASAIPVLKSFYQGSGPARSTSYQTELYDAFKELEAINRTMNSLKKNKQMDAYRELKAETADKMRLRPTVNAAKKRLDEIRQKIDQVNRSNLSAAAKRARLDALMRERNQISRKAAHVIQGAF